MHVSTSMTTLQQNNSVNQTCNLYAHRDTAKILMPLHYSLVCIIGLLGNGLALAVIHQNKRKINSTTLYSINLVLSDILFTTALPTRIAYYALGFHWPFGEAFCRITAFIFYTNTYAGVYFMTCLSIDRFFAVVHPFRYNKIRKIRCAVYLCSFVWILVLLQTFPLLLQTMSKAEPEGWITCMEYPNFETIPQLPIMLLGACFIGYLLPIGLILFFYCQISNKLCHAAKENPLTEKSGMNKKANTTIIFVIVTFVICFSPYHIAIMQHMIKKFLYIPLCKERQTFQISLHVTVCLMNFNCCMDPFIYFFACRGYKRIVMKILRRQVSMSLSSTARQAPGESSRDAAESQMMMAFTNTINGSSSAL
ncbi:G-protein coupled receptor 183 [Microcaecilia unicolor]|uniref:G-protein coupled receptor 183-like n=1 Tax=Microcaecilia unicolor TaxID=1415580 RepID=A0A6P7Y2I1_9AMPH|nr:G-protein coupled receptor 183-like [Microcaecilia unicolor]